MLIAWQTKIFITSEVPIAQIFAEDGNGTGGAVSDQMRQMMDDLVSLYFGTMLKSVV